ncbi:hypothetical protein H2201_008318 [Coniosporium apollinis]|uniref:Hydrophobin n=2 Tax=Coniosporium TaxID=2810619 RepID=A0ABQ9NHA5_9PEZI|nr:hypothetical protein H2199_007897 [Cladosporium sp. JES 115]KAJ9657041.1 hypothetical protein H2201_008318 [Coniosporium apollinis]
MLMHNILAVLAVTVAVSAAPAPQDQTQQCGNGLTLKCCNQIVRQRRNGIPINIGLQCTDIDVISVIPIDQQCLQEVACCQSGAQTGLINVANVCPQIL